MFALKASVIRRIERLEGRIHPAEPELPPIDLGLLIESESAYFSKVSDLLRNKARELGYGDKNNKVSWFDLGRCDPLFNAEVEEECLQAMNDDEKKIIETFHGIIRKCLRLTVKLSDDEKLVIKKYNEVVMFFGSSIMMDGAQKGWLKGHTREELVELRSRYEEIMRKYGEPIYE